MRLYRAITDSLTPEAVAAMVSMRSPIGDDLDGTSPELRAAAWDMCSTAAHCLSNLKDAKAWPLMTREQKAGLFIISLYSVYGAYREAVRADDDRLRLLTLRLERLAWEVLT